MSDSPIDIFQFPCAFPIKAFGRNSDDFEALVISIVRRHAPDLDDRAVTRRISRGDAYRAVTATITAHSREQLDALYTELSGHAQVLMVL